MPQWEYRVVGLPHDRTQDDSVANETVKVVHQQQDILNEYGAQGWELVGFDTVARSGGDGSYRSIAVLKRTKP